MVNVIFYCPSCKKYTMEKVCSCGEETIQPKPAKFGLEDRYGYYRRKYKETVEK